MRSMAYALGSFLGKQSADDEKCPPGKRRVSGKCSTRWFGGIVRDAQRDMGSNGNGNGNGGDGGGSGNGGDGGGDGGGGI